MLQFIRDRAQGLFVWIILTIIIAAFALVGVNSYLTGDGRAYAAKVNDTKIGLSDYQAAVQQERNFRQQIFGDKISPALLKEEVLQRAALDRLITGEVVAQAADNAGFSVSNSQLANQILHMQAFQTNGQFDQAIYARTLDLQGYSEEHFEDTMRKDMLSKQFLDGLIQTAFVTEAEIDQLLRLKKQQRRFAYMVIKSEDFVDDLIVDDEAVKQFYNDHAAEFTTEDRVSINYLELTPGLLDTQIAIDEERLKQMYQEQVVEFSNSEERRASHILIKPSDDSDAEVQAASKKAKSLYEEILAGSDFAELAQSNSDDPGSAQQGGDLGYFGRGMMVGAFEDMAFTMKEGDVSEPVKSPYGFHIIKLTAIKQGDTKSFDEVREELVSRFLKDKSEELFFDRIDLLADLTFEHPDTLGLAAQELGITIKTSELFSRGFGQGIANDERIREAAFSADVLDGGNNSDLLTLDDSHVAVIRINERRPAAPRPLSEVREGIIKRIRQQQASEKLEQIGNDVLAKIRQGEAPETLAQAQGVEWSNSGFIDRNDAGVNRQVLNYIFQIARPDQDQAVMGGSALSTGDYVVAALYAVRDGDPAEVEEQERQSLTDSYRTSKGQHLGAKIIDNLKQRASIVEYLDQIDN